jgi:putrescine aminotransferase
MTKKLLSLKDIYNLDITEIKSHHSDFLNTNQSKMLSKFSYGKDKFVKADGVYLYTDSGKKILDFSGGIGVLNHGHNNQAVLDARVDFQKNKRMEVHKTVFSPYMAGLAHNIAQLLPKNLCKSFFCNSGSESVEGAIKAAYKFHKSKRKYILHSDISFHGKTIGAGSISGAFDQSIFPRLNNTKSFKYNDKESVELLINDLKNENGESNVFALIIETFNNTSLRECSDEFVEFLRDITKRNKIILIFDEVYTGWGKTGYLFHFFKYKNISPDILCTSKSLGGGKSSISAFIVDKLIYKKAYENYSDAFLHTSTYNGFGEECITAVVAINELIENKLVENSKNNGLLISKKLSALKAKFPKYISDVRGIGSIQGIVLNYSSIKLSKKVMEQVPILNKSASIMDKVPSAILSDYLYSKFDIFTIINENKNDVLLMTCPSLIINEKEIIYFFDSLESCLETGLNKIFTNFLLKNLI